MLRGPIQILGAGLLIVALLAGCSNGVEDGPAPSPFPARPALLDVERLSECAMLSERQQEDLNLRQGMSGRQLVDGVPARTCAFLGESGVDINTQVIAVDAAVARRLPSAAITQVRGFGAVMNVVATRPSSGPVCQVAIDAAQGQTIRVQALSRTDPPPVPIDQICQRATDTASMVMTTVVATASR